MSIKPLGVVPEGAGLKPIYGAPHLGFYEALRAAVDPNIVEKRRERFGDITYINFFGRRAILPATPQTVEAAVMNTARDFKNEPAWDFLIGVAFKRGIMLMDFDEHRQQRLIMQQAFTNNNLKGYMQEMAPMLAERLDAFPTGEVRLAHQFKELILDVALEVFVGAKLSRAQADRVNRAFLDCLAGLTAVVRRPVPGGKWRRGIAGRRTLEEFFYELLPEKRRRETPDLFSILCHAKSDEGDVFTDQQVVDHMIFVLFAAHDTSTTALTTMAYYMSKQPQWQDRARNQSLQLPEQLSYDALSELTELDLILKESLRLNAPVPVLAREAIRDTALGEYYVPKGSFVLVQPQAVHLNPAVWKDPQHFDPERFTKERAEDKVHRFAWFPFGGGVHKCIGLYFAQMEIKSIMHGLLLRYEWEVPASYTWRRDPRTLNEPTGGLKATVRAR